MKKNSNSETNPIKAKIVLTIFGLGPIIAMVVFLAFNGFFEAPGS